MNHSRKYAAHILVALTISGCQFDEDADVASDAAVAVYAAPIDDDPPDDDPPGPPPNPCLTNTTGTFTATPMTKIAPFQRVTLAWNVTVPSNCTVRILLNGTQVERTGTMIVYPQADQWFILSAAMNTAGQRVIRSRQVTVEVPPVVYITANTQVPLFVQAVQSEGRTVVVSNDVQLDLSGRADIVIASGVTIRSGRGGRQLGARLFTTTRPGRLFKLDRSANVRVTGIRIQGSDGDRALTAHGDDSRQLHP